MTFTSDNVEGLGMDEAVTRGPSSVAVERFLEVGAAWGGPSYGWRVSCG